jgi:hypothetical protein
LEETPWHEIVGDVAGYNEKPKKSLVTLPHHHCQPICEKFGNFWVDVLLILFILFSL